MKALIVDDHPDIVEMLSVVLKNEKFEVDAAVNGEEAVEFCRRQKYDLIILDLMMPKKSGIEVITSLRSLKIETPILVLSARGRVEDKTLALNLGADDYLVKDFAVSELMARVKSLLRRANGSCQNIMRCGGLMVNLTDMSVRRKGHNIALTKKEFALLSTLIWHKNRVTSFEKLATAAWGEINHGDIINKINVHIRTLRNKVDRPFGEPLIQTVRGFGYKLTCPPND